MSENYFIEASRLKTRFLFKGTLTVEDLWDLPLSQLDQITVGLKKKLDEVGEESFIPTKNRQPRPLKVAFEVAKAVIEIRLQEAAENEQALTHKQEVEKIDRLIEEKKDASLGEKSLEELQAMRDKL